MTSRRDPELLRSSQIVRVNDLLGMLEIPPKGYSDPHTWERRCKNLGLPKLSYPDGTYSTVGEPIRPGLGVMLYIPGDGLVEWIAEHVPLSDEDRQFLLVQHTLTLMGE